MTADGVCGLPLRVEVPAAADAGAVHAVLLVHPDAELRVEVGDEIARADAARRLLDQLEAATPHAPATSNMAAGTRSDGGP